MIIVRVRNTNEDVKTVTIETEDRLIAVYEDVRSFGIRGDLNSFILRTETKLIEVYADMVEFDPKPERSKRVGGEDYEIEEGAE